MAFLFRREARKRALSRVGFLPFESSALSAIPTGELEQTPYLRQMVNNRKALMRQALKEGWTKKRYIQTIKGLYDSKDWKLNKEQIQRRGGKLRLGNIVADPWAMVRQIEDEHRRKNPAYQSPWQAKKQKEPHLNRKALQTKQPRKRPQRTEVIAGIKKDLQKPQSGWRRGQLEAQLQHLERLEREEKERALKRIRQ